MTTYDPALTQCPLCKSKAIASFDRDYRGNSISVCHDCRVKFMNPQYSDAHLTELYSNYWTGEPVTKHRCRSDVRSTGKARAFDLLERFTSPGKVLMIGCGDGLELKIAADAGWEAEGYDIDEDTARLATSNSGVPVYHGDFQDLQLEPESFDAVYMDQVIEHPKEPAIYLSGAHRLLRSGGLLYLGTPNIGSISNRLKTMIGKLGLREHRRGRHYATQHHLFFYTPGVMKDLLERYGFEVVDLRGSMKPQKKKKPLTAVLNRWFPNVDSSFVAVARKR